MALTKTPICDFGKKAEGFSLKSTDNKSISLNDIRGDNGTLIMFICNHCPHWSQPNTANVHPGPTQSRLRRLLEL